MEIHTSLIPCSISRQGNVLKYSDTEKFSAKSKKCIYFYFKYCTDRSSKSNIRRSPIYYAATFKI